MEQTLFFDLTVIVCVTVLLALLMKILRQPAIISYILVGVLVSPYGLNIVGAHGNLEIFSQMGVSFLLFMVGLNLNPKIVREMGKVSVVTGVGQVVVTTALGYVLGRWFGFDRLTSLYIAIALTFSSTIIVMKMLGDKGELETLHGRISTGFLIVQDIIAMALLLGVSSAASDGGTWQSLVLHTAVRAGAFIAVLLGIGIFVLPRLLRTVASSQELLLLFSIGWCFAIAALCHALGLSMEIGALAAGIVLSLSPYRFEINAKLKPLRDFFIVLFFVLIGAQMTFADIRHLVVPIVVFSLFVIIGNPLIMLVIMGAMRFTKRTSFKTGLAVAQVSEFSFILVALGVRLGHLEPSILSFVTLTGLITIACSTYFMEHGDMLYKLLEKPLSLFERRGKKADEHHYAKHGSYDILLLGYERVGLNVLEALKRTGKKFLVVDYNPTTVVELAKAGIDCRYGDLGDADFLDELNFAEAKMVVSTIRDFDVTTLLVGRIRAANKHAVVIALSQQIDQALHLYELGASYVITPQFLGGYHASLLIEECGFDLHKFLIEKTKHLQHLEQSRKHQNVA
ncbi:MAG: cation:proton antiporter [Candidatus Peribacteraceae bacterium]|nr:cation:proton antiporter [Candidatus Peribacteraceae bacterium]